MLKPEIFRVGLLLAGVFSLILLFMNAAVAVEPSYDKRVSLDQREKMRGEMRQAWANMTPEERDALRREYPDGDDAWILRMRGDDARNPRQATSHRSLSPAEHHYLRRQLRDLSQEDRR